jgi:hypothetical protein
MTLAAVAAGKHVLCEKPFAMNARQGREMYERARGAGTFLISNNAASLRGRKRLTGQSLYYPRVMMRTLAQVLTNETRT